MRAREQLLEQWSDIRAKIAGGCTNDGPRLWFEGVLDELTDEIENAYKRGQTSGSKWADRLHRFGGTRNRK